MKKGKNSASRKRATRIKNPVAAVDEHLHPLPQFRTLASLPGAGAVLERARIPYQKRRLTEDEALNLICDARSDEPTHPLEKLIKKFKA